MTVVLVIHCRIDDCVGRLGKAHYALLYYRALSLRVTVRLQSEISESCTRHNSPLCVSELT